MNNLSEIFIQKENEIKNFISSNIQSTETLCDNKSMITGIINIMFADFTGNVTEIRQEDYNVYAFGYNNAMYCLYIHKCNHPVWSAIIRCMMSQKNLITEIYESYRMIFSNVNVINKP